jgi:hypothetical protein
VRKHPNTTLININMSTAAAAAPKKMDLIDASSDSEESIRNALRLKQEEHDAAQRAKKAERLANEKKARAASIAEQKAEYKTTIRAASASSGKVLSKEERKADALKAAAAKKKQK